MPQGKGTYGNKVGRPPKKMKVLRDGGTPNTDIKVKGVSTKGLTKRQAETLKKHAVHHSKKHIQAMVKDMIAGATFSQSHKKAQKSVGT